MFVDISIKAMKLGSLSQELYPLDFSTFVKLVNDCHSLGLCFGYYRLGL